MDCSPKLVYRALVQISHYTVQGFYEEVHVEGKENVPAHTPLVVASTHHNEIIDIASLAITIPHARHLSFWAKSSLFSNPVVGGILSSSGAIPVQRNPNAIPGPSSTQPSQESLFHSTSRALEKGEAVGVFPEGTSYTEPGIVQMKDGAAWAAVEYAKTISGKEGQKEAVEVIPVAVVYTDKSRYRSRIVVHYGAPISVPPLSPGGDQRAAVKQLTSDIQESLLRLSINAPDWDTLNSAKIALSILGDPTEVPMGEWVGMMQTLICLLSSTSIDPISLEELKRALVAYFALLCYTGTSHVSLQYLLPLSSGSNVHASTTTTRIATARLILPFLRLLHPRTLLFLPPMLVFLPGHALGSLAGRYLAVAPAAPSTPAELAEMKKRKERVEMADEEESKAQYKAVIGGVGVSFGCYLAGRLVLGSLVRLGLRSRAPAFGSAFSSALLTSLGLGGWESSRWVQGISSALDGTAEWAHIIGAFLGASEGGARSSMMRGLGKLGVIYATGWVVVKWHNLLIGWNKTTLSHMLTSCRLLLSIASRPVPRSALAQYLVPPRPAVNPYIKRSETSSPAPQRAEAMPARRLMHHLLRARRDATYALEAYIGGAEKLGEDGTQRVRYLRERGLRI
ncbi:acyltransferase [Athelia psychrophila]|uniref:Acyltransferase n=1 Tax=Athelia psychrophila TaxID=1759441 RepID=A0A166WT92_9AGAM|nr:acyltransferase [Fibularhizoctonia sp. CBS 109695]